jgi:hypothetical protein
MNAQRLRSDCAAIAQFSAILYDTYTTHFFSLPRILGPLAPHHTPHKSSQTNTPTLHHYSLAISTLQDSTADALWVIGTKQRNGSTECVVACWDMRYGVKAREFSVPMESGVDSGSRWAVQCGHSSSSTHSSSGSGSSSSSGSSGSGGGELMHIISCATPDATSATESTPKKSSKKVAAAASQDAIMSIRKHALSGQDDMQYRSLGKALRQLQPQHTSTVTSSSGSSSGTVLGTLSGAMKRKLLKTKDLYNAQVCLFDDVEKRGNGFTSTLFILHFFISSSRIPFTLSHFAMLRYVLSLVPSSEVIVSILFSLFFILTFLIFLSYPIYPLSTLQCSGMSFISRVARS